jgi:phenylalanyl-tRNA synthetase beta chain
MPTITLAMEGITSRGIDKKAFKGLVDKLGMSLEKMDDKDAVIEITPDRPDLLEVNGLCRALRFLSGKTAPKENHYALKGKPYLTIKVGKAVKKCRPFIAGFVVQGADLKGNKIKELMNFQEKLHETYGRKRKKMSIGIHDLDRIEGDVIYDAAKGGAMTPLGSQKEMGFQDVMKFAADSALDSMIADYKNYPHVKDAKKVISLVPVLNSEATRVTESAKNLFIEITGTHWQTVDDTANILACLFVDAGAEVLPCSIEGGPVKTTPTMSQKEFKLAYSKFDRTLGSYFRAEDIITLANHMGYVSGSYESRILFVVPPYRTDVINERDIIEDIAIAYGYDKVVPIPILGASVGVPDELTEDSEAACAAMVGLGFSEAFNTCLTNESQCFEMVRRKVDEDAVVRVAYAKTETLSILRDCVMPSLFGSLSASMQATLPQKMFEIGSVFRVEKGKVIESRNIAMVSEHAKANFSEIKGMVFEFLKAIGAPKPEIKEGLGSAFIEGRCAMVFISGKPVGILGEVHPEVLSSFGLEEPVVAAELSLETILSLEK